VLCAHWFSVCCLLLLVLASWYKCAVVYGSCVAFVMCIFTVRYFLSLDTVESLEIFDCSVCCLCLENILCS